MEAIRRGEEIWVAEGEKDVHALEIAGVTATCNPGGAGKWRNEYTEWLARAGRAAGCDGFLRVIRLVIVRDRDDAGQAHAQDLAVSFTEHHLAWRAVEAAEGKDAADHLAAGLGLEDFRPIEVPAERPNRIAFNGYRRRRTHGVNWSEGPERISREFEGWS